jgi:Fur family iron response transcriptional regulator
LVFSNGEGILLKPLILKGNTMDRDQFADRLVEHGVQPTVQRVEIAELVLSKPQHLSAEQIISALRARGARVSKATVYNTLNLFCDRGLLRAIDVDPVRQYYDSTTAPHHHFFNEDTGELTDIPIDAIDVKLGTELPPETEQASVEVFVRVRSAR